MLLHFPTFAVWSSADRQIPTGRNETTPLAQLPVMRDTVEEIEAVMQVLRHFAFSVEESFINDQTITDDLVHRIACGKIESVGFCIDAILALKVSDCQQSPLL